MKADGVDPRAAEQPGDPGPGTFIGQLRTLTGNYAFELPTEAQWEYACRAGTTTDLNSGKNLTTHGDCPNMNEVGRNSHNREDGNGGGFWEHATVGSYLKNDWDLYDMHGNIWEWCLDMWNAEEDYTSDATDPVGPGDGLAPTDPRRVLGLPRIRLPFGGPGQFHPGPLQQLLRVPAGRACRSVVS